MAKEKSSVIALEIEKYKSKISEFQIYLETHDIRRIEEFDTEQDKYKEIDMQMKIMSVIPNWLLALKNLEEDVVSKMETRGEAEIPDIMKNAKIFK